MESEAKGPYTEESLKGLVESGKLTRDCFIFDEEKDGFIPFSEKPDFWQRLKPVEKPGLKLKKKTPEVAPSDGPETPAGNQKKKITPPATQPQIGKGLEDSVDLNQVLAAAEGNTRETSHVKRPKLTQLRAARVIIPGLCLAFLIFLSAVIGAFYEPLYEMISKSRYELGLFLQNWILFFALIDFFLMVAIGLGRTNVFPLLRFRACLGVGFFCFIYYSTQNWEAMAALSAYQIGLFASTLTVRFLPTLFYLVLSIAGASYFSYLFWSGNLVL